MPPLKLLHVTPYSPEAWAYGGIPRLIRSLTRELVRRGHQVTVCATDVADANSRLPRPGVPRTRLEPWAPFVTGDGVELRVFPNLSNRAAYHWQAFMPLGLADYLREHAGSFDVAHLHACRNLPGVLAAWHLREAGVPYVLAPNGTALRLERRLMAKRVFDAVFGNRVMRGAARVLAVAEAERRQLLAAGVPSDAIAVVPNPVDLDEFDRPVSGQRLRRRADSGAAPVVLFLGKLTPRKRLDVLIEAFAKLGRDDARLVIAGNDMGAGAAARAQVEALGLSARTTFTGLLRGAARLQALADADVVVYPSENEIFGLVPVEALLAGSPVVVSDDSGSGEVIRSTGGGKVVRLGDSGELAEAIRQTLDDPAGSRRAAQDGADQVRARFAGPVVAGQIEALYRRVLESHPEPHPHQATMENGPQPRSLPGASFVVPVRNGARWLETAIGAIWAQAGTRQMEIVVVNDGSTDGSAAIIDRLASERPIRILEGYGRGAAAALNLGFRESRYPLVAQVDQDVVLQPGWLDSLARALEDGSVAAAQGYYESRIDSPLAARVTGLDLELRYSAIEGTDTDHVCTGNSVYRRQAVIDVGLFDERFGYGYDNDMSYRLKDAGHRLVFCRDARSVHHWREGLRGFCTQQYGVGYGRLDLVAKHPGRTRGDAVSPLSMMAHPAAMALACICLFASGILFVAGGPWALAIAAAGGLIAALAAERLVAGVRAVRRFGDPAALLFPVFHLCRDFVWVLATGVWLTRRQLGRPRSAIDSMRPRPPDARVALGQERAREPLRQHARILGVIPAHNEAATLPGLVEELRSHCPHVDILVVDDGSRDNTVAVLEGLDVRWLSLPDRMGIGSAMRAGLRYAQRLGYEAAVRLDGDGQHGVKDIEGVLAPLRRGEADVVLGSRFAAPERSHTGMVRMAQRVLAAGLSRLTGAAVTDPTSGFCAIGHRALRVLAEHHPTGYPEPELRLFLNRNGLTAVEVPVDSRPRLGGRSSLTPGRITLAAARILLAMLIVPLRSIVVSLDRD